MEEVKNKRSKEVTLVDRYTEKEFDFKNTEEASEFLGITKVKLSQMIRNKKPNYTRYFISTD